MRDKLRGEFRLSQNCTELSIWKTASNASTSDSTFQFVENEQQKLLNFRQIETENRRGA